MLNSQRISSKPRILFVGAFPPHGKEIFGGNVTACKALLASSFSERSDLYLLDSTQVSNPPPGLAVRLFLAARRFCSYILMFERVHCDVVLLFTSVGASMVEKGAMAWYSHLRGTPAMVFPRGGAVIDACNSSRFTRSWVRIALRGARKILCQGPAWQKFAVDVLGVSSADAPIITNWTATPSLLELGRARSFSNGEKPVRLLFLGWLEKKKGVFELIEASREIAQTRNFALDIVGEGNASVELRKQVLEYGLEEKVHFWGWLKSEEVASALAKADVLVLPSWAEGLPNAMIEAMAAKLAVVVSAVGNIPEMVSDGKEALLVPPKDVAALTDALIRLIDNPALRQRLACSAFLLAKNQWGVEQAVDGLLAAVNSSVRKPLTVATDD